MTLTRLASAAALGLALTGTAFAADLPLRSAPPPFVPPPPVFTWTGFYAGLNAGYAFDAKTRFNTGVGPGGALPGVNPPFLGAPGTRANVNDDGFTGGGQIGYNYQFGAGSGVVVGVEADAQYTDLDRRVGIDYTGVSPLNSALGGTGTAYRGGLDFLGTVRGRVGYAFNQFMIYGTGGFAYGEVNNSVNVFTAPGALFAAGGRSDLQTGYTYGGGLEYAIPTASFLNVFHSSAVTVKAEYLHYDLGGSNIAVNTGAANTYNTRVTNSGDLIRAGINYKFQ